METKEGVIVVLRARVIRLYLCSTLVLLLSIRGLLQQQQYEGRDGYECSTIDNYTPSEELRPRFGYKTLGS